MKEEILGTAEIRDIQNFKVDQSQVVWLWTARFQETRIKLSVKEFVVHAGELIALKRFKDDVKRSGQVL
jgi:translation initiation factor IF-2